MLNPAETPANGMRQPPRFTESYPKEWYVQLRREGDGCVSDAFDWVFDGVANHLEALRTAGRLGRCKFAKRRGNQDALEWNDFVNGRIEKMTIDTVLTDIIWETISNEEVDKSQSDDEAYQGLCKLFDTGDFGTSYFLSSTCHVTGAEICFALQGWTGQLYALSRRHLDPSKVDRHYLLTEEAPRHEGFELWKLNQ